MNTSFRINCSGWQDPDQPLTYEFSYINYVQESVFYVSSEPIAPSMVLPMGHETNDFNLTLNIQITDRWGSSTVKKVVIKVGRCDRNLFGSWYDLGRGGFSSLASRRVVGKKTSLWYAFHKNYPAFRHSYVLKVPCCHLVSRVLIFAIIKASRQSRFEKF